MGSRMSYDYLARLRNQQQGAKMLKREREVSTSSSRVATTRLDVLSQSVVGLVRLPFNSPSAQLLSTSSEPMTQSASRRTGTNGSRPSAPTANGSPGLATM